MRQKLETKDKESVSKESYVSSFPFIFIIRTLFSHVQMIAATGNMTRWMSDGSMIHSARRCGMDFEHLYYTKKKYLGVGNAPAWSL
jgi:hypothetical protein